MRQATSSRTSLDSSEESIQSSDWTSPHDIQSIRQPESNSKAAEVTLCWKRGRKKRAPYDKAKNQHAEAMPAPKAKKARSQRLSKREASPPIKIMASRIACGLS